MRKRTAGAGERAEGGVELGAEELVAGAGPVVRGELQVARVGPAVLGEPRGYNNNALSNCARLGGSKEGARRSGHVADWRVVVVD